MNSQNPKGMMSKALTCGVVGVLAVAIEPILLTRLYELEKIGAEAIGIAICVELIGMAFGSVIGAKLLGAGNTSRRIVLTTLLLATANLLTPMGSESWVIVLRLVAGVAGGVLIWVTITTIVRSSTPERWSGFYLSGHTAVQFVVAAIVAALVIPSLGAYGGYALLAAITVLLIPVALKVPDIRPYEHKGQISEAGYPISTWPTLVSIMLLNAMLMSVMSYAEIEFQFRGFPVEETLAIVPIMLGAQIMGGLVAALIAPRLPKILFVMLVIGILTLLLGQLAGLVGEVSTGSMYFAFAAFGFCWLFVGPFHLGFLLDVSKSLQSAELLAAAQLAGLAIGPLIGAALLTSGGHPPLAYHLALIALSFLFLVVGYMTRSRSNLAEAAPAVS